MRTTQEAGAVDDIGGAVFDGREQREIIFWIVFEVGVLHEKNLAGSFLQAAAQSRSLALIFFLIEHANIVLRRSRYVRAQVLQNFARAIRRRVVDEHDFLVDFHGDYPAEQFLDCGAFVVYGNYNREARSWFGFGGHADFRLLPALRSR